MITENLINIERLREIRERSAFVALLGSNATRDSTAMAAMRFENHLLSQTAAQLASEAKLYEETLGKPLAPQELETVYSQIQRESSEIDALAQRCLELKDTAAKAASDAEEARLKHARLLQAQKKWAKLREYHSEKTQIEEVYREEIAFDDISKLPNNGL